MRIKTKDKIIETSNVKYSSNHLYITDLSNHHYDYYIPLLLDELINELYVKGYVDISKYNEIN